MKNPSLYLDGAALHPSLHPYRSFNWHIEITLQDVPNREYTLRLFVENVERELQRKDNHIWTPAERQYVHYFSNTYTHWWICMHRDVFPTSRIRAEVRMKSGHSVWAKYRAASEVMDLHGLFNDYWSTKNYEFTVLSQSITPTSPHRVDREGQRLLSLENIAGIWKYGSLQIVPFVPLRLPITTNA